MDGQKLSELKRAMAEDYMAALSFTDYRKASTRLWEGNGIKDGFLLNQKLEIIAIKPQNFAYFVAVGFARDLPTQATGRRCQTR